MVNSGVRISSGLPSFAGGAISTRSFIPHVCHDAIGVLTEANDMLEAPRTTIVAAVLTGVRSPPSAGTA